MKYDISKLRKSSKSVHEYVSEPSKAKEAFEKRQAEYKLDEAVVKELKKWVKDYFVVVFSAEWCPDCLRNLPVIDKVAETTGLEVRVFGHIMRDAKSNTREWAVPPSPPEVNEFKVTKIPLIVVLRKNGEMVGEIIENPPQGVTVEKALLDLMK